MPFAAPLLFTVITVLVARLSGSRFDTARATLHLPSIHPLSSCPGLSRASTCSLGSRQHVDGRDKPGHDEWYESVAIGVPILPAIMAKIVIGGEASRRVGA